MRPFRFSLQIDPSTADLDTVGRAAEEAGFDVLTTSDHVGASRSPLLALTHVAARTSSIGLGTMVLNNDMRNPVQLAWDAATLQHLSGGRFELGLGAGHTPHEYAATGITLDPPADRKARLAA
ncbi:MAG: LLM class flavin-dependent oxidoreductase, partial [Actinomycetota bacterium]